MQSKKLYLFRKVKIIGSLLVSMVSPATGPWLVVDTTPLAPIGWVLSPIRHLWLPPLHMPLLHHCACLAKLVSDVVGRFCSWIGLLVAVLLWQLV